MVAKDFPCKTCNHAAIKHFSNISDGETVCVTCIDLGDYDKDHHPFIGDNLKYMELLTKKKELKGE